MLPFTALSGYVELDNGIRREISVCELAPAYLTFRLCAGERPEKDAEVELHFSKLKENAPQTLSFVPETVTECGKDGYSVFFKAYVKNKEYTSAVMEFSHEYIKYVNDRIFLPDSRLAAEYTKTPPGADTDFPENIREYRRLCFENVTAGREWYEKISSAGEIAVTADRPDRYENFLEKPVSEYYHGLLSENFLQEHPAAQLTVNTVVIGNEYCLRLFPDPDILKKLLEKAEKEKLHAVITLGPAGPDSEDRVCKILRSVTDPGAEIVINDLGTALLARKILGGKAFLRLGPLMNRSLCDPRTELLRYTLPATGNGLSASAFRVYLKDRFDISGYSSYCSENMTCPPGTAVYLPYCRTNTSLQCTLRAVCENGDRSKQTGSDGCPMYCRDNVFLYPRSLKEIGMYNSLFCALPESLTDPSLLPAGKIDRIVFDFI